MSEELSVKIDKNALKLILDATEPYYYRVDSLIEDYYQGIQIFDNTTIMSMMELRITLQILVTYLQDLLEQAEEEGVQCLYLRPQEVKTIASLSKGISSATLIQLGNTNLRDQ
tara:strand:- start:775 stop:1113 length:339 start_codon:yes stop_codon:yes gene_type:complete